MTASDPAEVAASPLAFLGDPDPATRRLAVSMLTGRVAEVDVTDRLLALVAGDPDGAVRAEAAEILGAVHAPVVMAALLAACGDKDPRVVEAAITALGEQPPAAAIVATITAAAIDGGADKLVREAAVAALGSLADPGSVPVLLDLLVAGPPQLRRRAVVALTVFDDPAIEPALRVAATDRNPMVREVAEMVVGHQRHGAEAGSPEPPR